VTTPMQSENDARRGSATAPRETRHVPLATQVLLWGRAAGRCEFAGCNKPLWKSPVTQEGLNVAQQAHIYSFSTEGPRGHAAIAPGQVNQLQNLMLVCHACHRKMDARKDGGRYPASLLRAMKREHERRIEVVTAISADRKSHVLLYGANIGDHGSPLGFNEAAMAMFPTRYPAEDFPIELGTMNGPFVDRDAEFWAAEEANLVRKFNQRVKERIAAGDVRHLSVFALAPQPLIVLLGTLLGDILPMDVYQRHREPTTWEWPVGANTPAFEVREPEHESGPAALVVALSASVGSDRITRLLGTDASIWTVTVAAPHNDLMKSQAQLAQLRILLRALLDRIKAAKGQATRLHVFPVAPVSAAVELGRIRMPKADMPWQVYDQVNARGGFIPALTIGEGAE